MDRRNIGKAQFFGTFPVVFIKILIRHYYIFRQNPTGLDVLHSEIESWDLVVPCPVPNEICTHIEHLASDKLQSLLPADNHQLLLIVYVYFKTYFLWHTLKELEGEKYDSYTRLSTPAAQTNERSP